MTLVCPHCSKPIQMPPRLPRVLAKCFEFIRANPGCSLKRISEFVYKDTTRSRNIIHVQIHKLQSRLLPTEYRLIRTGEHYQRRYSIVLANPTPQPPESPANGTEQLNPSLP